MNFIHADFMLNNKTAKHLFHDYARDLPIFDYHCHLSPEEIAKDHAFENITELWLSGDHYKWRAMRANGVSEEKVTGSASPKEKFLAWANTAENAIGNPLFHWTQLELKKYFGIEELLNSDNAEQVYEKINKKIERESLTARKFIQESNVEFIGTTDSPLDSLEFHEQIAEDDSFDITVVPAFRPDEFFLLKKSTVKKLEEICGQKAYSYKLFIEMLETRVEHFDKHGSVLSDHGLNELIYNETTSEEIEHIYQKVLEGQTLTAIECNQWTTRLLIDLAQMYAKRDWVMQIHFGAIRNAHSQLFTEYGPDAGADSIADQPYLAENLNALLDAMNKKEALPKMVLYNLNPEYNAIVASTAANFQSNEQEIKSKVQFGSGWWFNDTEKGILRQLETLSDHGMLMHFVGMITDSRSFISYTRHEYFRRILCNYVGEQVELGKFPEEESLLKKLIQNICYFNAKAYFKPRSS
ncbi:glucuronate isomerase [Marinilactibacillus sp. XAAS-LB27]|uniref:glucuronate isomerase n=1 Tax=Marinilactibacillus sp. XAAS-LB27 TaxID=3114538 RepID=UPI002E1762AA|nr:glucuronate isomerase [Marinilactibacillus sp. XAAS-LB27]